MVEKLADPMRYILFLTSFSVILITSESSNASLEAITFFQDIADSRGWFGLDLKWMESFSKVLLVLLLGCLIIEILEIAHPQREKIPQKVLFP